MNYYLMKKTGKKAAATVTVLKKDEASLLTSATPKMKVLKEKKKERAEQPKSDASAFSDLGLDAEIVKALGFFGLFTTRHLFNHKLSLLF